jgi:hypothetical protein
MRLFDPLSCGGVQEWRLQGDVVTVASFHAEAFIRKTFFSYIFMELSR